jgi:hypothetical protein
VKNVLVPQGARCCTDHLVNNQLKADAIDMIKPCSVQDMCFTAGDVQLLIDGWQMVFQQQKRFDFDSAGYLSEDDCKTMIGLSKICQHPIFVILPTDQLEPQLRYFYASFALVYRTDCWLRFFTCPTKEPYQDV